MRHNMENFSDNDLDVFEHMLLIYIQAGLSLTRRAAVKEILRHVRQTRTRRKQLMKGMKQVGGDDVR